MQVLSALKSPVNLKGFIYTPVSKVKSDGVNRNCRVHRDKLVTIPICYNAVPIHPVLRYLICS